MKVGEQVQFQATFHDEAAATGYVVWKSDDPRILEWRPAEPACASDRCALLTAVGPGTTRVSIDTCPGLPTFGCAGLTARIDVHD
jgi:hypothetical protein